MKKYLVSILIPCLLLYLSGCYSMQEITKEEFSKVHDNQEYLVKTDKKEITFQRGDFYMWQDTIYGQGTCITLKNIEEPFDSSVGLIDIKEIQTEKFDLGDTILFSSGIAIVIVGFVALAIASTWSMDYGK